MAPQTSIISNGNHGGFDHPRQVTLDLYATLPGPPTVFQTNKFLKGDKGGNVPDEFIADLVPDGPEGTILVTVDANTNSYTVYYGPTSKSFQFSDGPPPAPVVIESLLPNPKGNDRKLEEVTIRNDGAAPIELVGWRLEDRSGGTWPLTGQSPLGPGGSRTILRDGMKMTLNNSGDRIRLIDAGNVVRDDFEYSGSTEGEKVVTGH